jgi:uncharacterized protein (TIGR02757 family)
MGALRAAVRRRPEPIDPLPALLESVDRRFRADHLETDPLRYPHRHADPLDRELVAFVSALLAFGQVKAIFRTLDTLEEVWGESPVSAVLRDGTQMEADMRRIRHRWIGGSDLVALVRVLRTVYRRERSLRALFLSGYGPADRSVAAALGRFSGELRRRFQEAGGAGRAGGFLFPDPGKGSACKRMNLFLRWVVRREAPDLGIWPDVDPGHLLFPIDTHLARIFRYIGVTRRGGASWKMVVEVTDRFRGYRPDDPVRYDFSLARLGILRQCRHRWDPACCPRCPLVGLCAVGSRGGP